MKAEFAEPSAVPAVSSDVVFDLGSPKFLVGLWRFAVPFASVPEASVNEDNEIDEGNEEVGFSGNVGMLDVGNIIGEKPTLEDEFRGGVLAPYPRHDPASLLLGNLVHNRNIVVSQEKRQEETGAMRQ